MTIATHSTLKLVMASGHVELVTGLSTDKAYEAAKAINTTARRATVTIGDPSGKRLTVRSREVAIVAVIPDGSQP